MCVPRAHHEFSVSLPVNTEVYVLNITETYMVACNWSALGPESPISELGRAMERSRTCT